MWKIQKNDNLNEKDVLFIDLMNECRNLPPGAKLSYNIRNRLDKFSIQDRSNIVNRLSGGCSPLFIVCRKGQLEVVEYLIVHCNAQIELRGVYEVPDDRSTHLVTPIWCASVSGKLKVVEILLKYGADINAVSDTGSTPVRSACFMTHFEVVKYLVEHGADINQPNYNGGTCLINSVQSSPLCEFLLKNGADVNDRDIQNKTALHYAIQEHRLETTKLLLKNGANIHAKSRSGDDALQMACLKGAIRIFEYLTTNFTYTPEKLANANELLGATFLDEHSDTIRALHFWKEGLGIREKYGLFPKQPIMEPIENYRFQKEFESLEELENISGDLDAIRTQSLLIAERVLGTNHKDTIFRLMYRGASYADMLRHKHCIYLWRRALEIRIKKDTILYTDTCFTAQALVRLMIDYNVRQEADKTQKFREAFLTYKLLTDDIDDVRNLLSIRPVYRRQEDFFDKILKCITHLIFLLVENATSNTQLSLVYDNVKSLVQKNLKTISTNDTLLHLCVSKNNIIRSSYFVDEDALAVFPHYNVLRLLLQSGATVNARNEGGCTPLHIMTSQLTSLWASLVESKHIKLLLDYRAHIDQPTAAGITSVNYINRYNKNRDYQIPILNYVNLKCLCATVICRQNIPYENQIPKTLVEFVRLHEIPKS